MDDDLDLPSGAPLRNEARVSLPVLANRRVTAHLRILNIASGSTSTQLWP